MNEFEHERLDVYKAAIEWLVLADAVAATLPRARGYLADQLRRAASSISFNIAEGAGEFAPAEKVRFYRMARRSATDSRRVSNRGASGISLPADRPRSAPAHRRDAHWGSAQTQRVGLGLGL